MTHRVLFLITSDPRTDPRPAEAIRIAAGVGARATPEVTVYLHGSAIRALDEASEPLVGRANLQLAWPIVNAWNRPIRVQRGAAELANLGEPAVRFEETDTATLAQIVRESTYVLRF